MGLDEVVERKTVDVGHTKLAVLEAGRGGPGLLLVHGFTGAKEDFADSVAPLAERGWHVVAPDLPGHGESDHPTGVQEYALQMFTDTLVALTNAIEWRTLAVLGHSMGGMIAQMLALEHTQRIDGLVLMDTTHGPPTNIDTDLLGVAKQVVRDDGLGRLVELQREMGDPLSTPAHRHLIETKPGYEEFCDSKLLASSPDMWIALIDEMFLHQPDRLVPLAGLTVPTLVIVGEQDRPFREPSSAMADAIPSATLAVIPDAGHAPQFENPGAWWSALTVFLDALRDELAWSG